MFSGIVQEIGVIKKIEGDNSLKSFSISAQNILKNKKIGDSIAVNGACLTVTSIKDSEFTCDAISETLEKTNLKALKEDDLVNLEPALSLNELINGHLVQGHIDCEGEVLEISENNKNQSLKIKFPSHLAKYLAFKGSICVNGVSLTISRLEEANFTVEIIPHTWQNTNLKLLKTGSLVNLETDMIGKYLERLLDQKANETKYEFLRERNLI